MVAGLAFAIGSMIYAWANKGHWIGPLIGVTIFIAGIYTIYQGGKFATSATSLTPAEKSFTVFTYLADACRLRKPPCKFQDTDPSSDTVYASSAMSAQSFARNFMGFIFPLFTTQMCKPWPVAHPA